MNHVILIIDSILCETEQKKNIKREEVSFELNRRKEKLKYSKNGTNFQVIIFLSAKAEQFFSSTSLDFSVLPWVRFDFSNCLLCWLLAYLPILWDEMCERTKTRLTVCSIIYKDCHNWVECHQSHIKCLLNLLAIYH